MKLVTAILRILLITFIIYLNGAPVWAVLLAFLLSANQLATIQEIKDL